MEFFEIQFETPCILRENFELGQSSNFRYFESLMKLLKNTERSLIRWIAN